MPQFQKDGQTITLTTPEDIQQATVDGYVPTTPGGTIPLVNADGRKIWVSPDKLDTFSSLGYAPEGFEAEFNRTFQEARRREYDTGSEALRTYGEGGLRAITGGLSDVGFRALGVDAADLEGRKEFNPNAELAGQIVGGTAAAVGSLGAGAVGKGLAFTPAGFASRLGVATSGKVAEALGGRALGTILGGVAGGALEGGIYGGGQAISDAAIQDKDLTADAFVSSVWSGALFGGALGGAANAIGPALTAGGKLTKAVSNRASQVVESVEGSIGTKARNLTDAITSPGPREATEIEMQTLRKAGDEAFAHATDLVSATGTKPAQKIQVAKKLEAFEEARRVMEEAADPAVVTKYHETLTDLSTSLNKAGKAIEVPPNPVLREPVKDGVTVTVGELAGKPAKGELAAARTEVKQAVSEMHSSGTPLLAEAKEIVSSQKPIAEIGGKDLSGLLDEVDSGAHLGKLVKDAEEARTAFEKSFLAGEYTAKQVEGKVLKNTDEVLDAMFQGSQEEFAGTIKTLERYDRSLRKLADELDAIAPRAEGPSRASQMGAGKFSRPATGVKVPTSEGYDLGDLLAIADFAGLDISDAPLIGQIPGLDTVLKARMLWRRFKGGTQKLSLQGRGARVAGVAARANAVQAKVEATAKAFFKTASTAASKARPALAPVSQAILQSVSYGPTPPPMKETKLEAFQRVSEELHQIAADPNILRQRVLARLDLGVPDLEMPIAEAAVRKAQYLYDELPKDPRDFTLMQKPWNPGHIAIDRFAECAWACENPAQAMALLPEGKLTMRMASAVRTVYPALFSQIQKTMLEELSKLDDLPLKKQAQLSAFLDLAVGPANSEGFAQAMQAGYQKPEQPGPEPGQNVRMTGLDRMTFPKTAAESRAQG